MSTVFQCPKCGSQDVYKGNKTILGGIGGIYGNRSKDVLRSFCRVCDIEALPLNSRPEGTALILPLSLLGIGLVWIFTYYVTSGQFPLGTATPLNLSNWNILIGFGITMVGFLLSRRKPK